jgi:hypothetical protein
MLRDAMRFSFGLQRRWVKEQQREARTIRVLLWLSPYCINCFGFCIACLLLSAFSIMIFFFVETPDFSSNLRFEGFFVELASIMMTSLGFHMIFLLALASFSPHQFQLLARSSKPNGACVNSTLTTIASFLPVLICATMDWMDRGIESGMDFDGTGTGMVLSVCIVALTTLSYLFLAGFYSDLLFYYGYWQFFPMSTVTFISFPDVVEVDETRFETNNRVDNDDSGDDEGVEDNDDDDGNNTTIAIEDDDDLVEDMDWEPTPDVKIFSCDEDTTPCASTSTCTLRDESGGVHFLPQLVTTGTGTTDVVTTGSTCTRDEANDSVPAKKKKRYRTCRLLLQPGRARRSIPEVGAVFLQDPVTATHIVPQDDGTSTCTSTCNEIARGTRIVASVVRANKKKKFRPCRLLCLQSGRARRSIPEGEAHIFQVPVISPNIVQRDDVYDADGIGRGCQMNASVCERDAPACDTIEKDEVKFKIETETGTESEAETKTLK